MNLATDLGRALFAQTPRHPDGTPKNRAEREIEAGRAAPYVFPEFCATFAINRDELIYKLGSTENWRGTLEDPHLHDCFRGCLDGIFTRNFIYGRQLDDSTLRVIVQLLQHEIDLPEDQVLNPDSVLTKLFSVSFVRVNRRDLARYRFVSTGEHIYQR